MADLYGESREVSSYPAGSAARPPGAFERLAAASPVGICFGEVGGPIRYANAALRQMLALGEEALSPDQLRWEHLTPPGFTQAEGPVFQALAETGACDPYAITLRAANGRSIPALVGLATVEEATALSGPVRAAFVTETTLFSQVEEDLRRRERILSAVADSAARLLRAEDWRGEINGILATLGPALAVDRIYLFENHTGADGSLHASQRHEWVAPGVVSQINNPDLQDASFEAMGFGRWADVLAAGQAISGRVRDFPPSERELLRAQQIDSLLIVPIFVGPSWWGFIGFDNLSPRLWSHAEHDALRAIAGNLGSVIGRAHAHRSLRRFEEVFAQAWDAFIITDPRGRVEYVNAGWEAISGIPPVRAIGAPLPWIDCDGEVRRGGFWPTFPAGQRWAGELHGLRPDGAPFQAEARVFPLTDPDGRFAQQVFVLRDTSERRRVQEELQRSLKLETLGRLTGGVAHDFNNLLQVIGGYVQVARLHAAEADVRIDDYLARAQTSCGEAAELIRQLLSLGRNQPRQMRLVDLNQVIPKMLGLLRRLLGEHVTLEFEPCAEIEPTLADPVQIDQILINLCLNARDAMPRGGTIRLETRRADGGEGAARDGFVRLAVRDTGCGIAPEILPRIFEPFFTTKDERHGTGIGLATVKSIVGRHAGHIDVRSAPARGTTVTIDLPAAPDGSREPGLEEPVTLLIEPGGGERVLVAEDEPLVRDLTVTLLEAAGYRVAAVADGAAAVDCLAPGEAPFDLYLLDLVMPRMGGREALARIRERHPAAAALFFTGYATDSLPPDLAPEDGEAILLKPFEPAQLLARVREALGARA